MNMWEDKVRVTRARENNLRVRLLGRNKSEALLTSFTFLSFSNMHSIWDSVEVIKRSVQSKFLQIEFSVY